MQSDDNPVKPTVRPISIKHTQGRRRGLRRHEGLALGLLAVIMGWAWFVTLTG
jgi:hypothetical protein